jgi:hypothetical protein
MLVAGRFGAADMGAQLSDEGEYLPPGVSAGPKCHPPQTIISVPVQTAVWYARPSAALAPVEVGVHTSLMGSYRAPVFAK